MTTPGDRIRAARQRGRLTQEQLARALGVSRKTVDNWENGRTSPRRHMAAIGDILGEEVYGDDEWWLAREAKAATDAARRQAGREDDRPDYMSEAAERIDLGEGYGTIWTETISEVAAEVDDVADELDEDAEELRERVKQNIIRQTRLFLDMERERAARQRQK